MSVTTDTYAVTPERARDVVFHARFSRVVDKHLEDVLPVLRRLLHQLNGRRPEPRDDDGRR